MSLRIRILVFVLMGTGMLTLLLYLIAQLVILEGFVEAEEQDLRENLESAVRVSYRMAEDLQLRGADWSSWDDMAAFLEDGNDEFRSSNFDAATFISIGWDLLVVVREDGKVLASMAVNRETVSLEPAPAGLSSWLPLLLKGIKTHSNPMVGFARVDNAFYALASSPILQTSKAPGRFAGRFIIGRRIDAAWLDRLKNFATEGVSLLDIEGALEPDTAEARTILLRGASSYLHPNSEELLNGYALINDIAGKPVMILRLSQPRELLTRGRQAIRSSILGVLLGGIAMSLAAYVFFGTVILTPLRRLLGAIEQLETGREAQLPVERSDELGTLMRGFNRMARSIHDRQLELTTAREQAEYGSRAKSDFLAAMSHEIRTPLNGVLGFADLLATTSLSPEQQEYVTTIRHSSHLLLNVINDILDYSRIEAGKLEIKFEAVPLLAAVRDVVELLSTRAEAKGLLLAVSLDSNAPEYVRGDPVRVRQILLNLLGNAVKFTDHGSVFIHIGRSTREEAALAELSIQDTGPGISPSDLPKLFRRFSQVDNTPARSHGGTGLGLAISKQLVEQHGGTIQVDSTPGSGSTFRFTLPVQARPELSRPAGALFPAPQLVPPGTPVLILHPIPLARVCLVRLFQRWGFPARVFATAQEAGLQAAATSSPLWLLSDAVSGQAIQTLNPDVTKPHPAIVLLASRHGEGLSLPSRSAPDAVVAGPVGLPHGLAAAMDLAWLAHVSRTSGAAEGAPGMAEEVKGERHDGAQGGASAQPAVVPATGTPNPALALTGALQIQSFAVSRGVTSGEFNALKLLAARMGAVPALPDALTGPAPSPGSGRTSLPGHPAFPEILQTTAAAVAGHAEPTPTPGAAYPLAGSPTPGAAGSGQGAAGSGQGAAGSGQGAAGSAQGAAGPAGSSVSPARPGTLTAPRPFAGRRLLLAEDNRVNQRLATTLLQRLGFDVVCADNGRLALEALRAEPFDLVLMDCHMPELDGFAATQAIRRDPSLSPSLPVIALSASAMQEEQKRCFTVGMNDFLAKPFTAAAIEAIVRKWLPEKPARPT